LAVFGFHERRHKRFIQQATRESQFSLTVKGSEFGLLSASMSGAETNSDNKPVGKRHFSLTVKGSEFGMSSPSMNGAMTDSDNKPSGNSHICLTAMIGRQLRT
jgi:hypothetical protein